MFRTSHWMLPLTIGALGAVLCTIALLSPRETPPLIVLPVQAGVLYRSPQLPPERLAEEIQRRGIKTVVNLGSLADTDGPVCREQGVNYVEVPVGDVWCLCGQAAPETAQVGGPPYDLQPLWKLLDDPAARPVLIHCQGGVHRTGAVVAMYRMRYQGWRADDAVAEMDLFGFQSRKPKYQNVIAHLQTLASPADATAQGRSATLR